MEELIALTKKLIAIPSETSNHEMCAKALGYAQKQLHGMNHHIFLSGGKPSALYTNQKKFTKHFKVLLNAHLDVVVGEKQQFKPFEKDGKLFGRGAFDMKAAAAALILVFKEVTPLVNYPLGLQLVLDEESGSADGTAYQAKKGIYGDFVLIGEGSNHTIMNKSKGRILLKLTTHGKTAHSGYSWLGKNAILEMQNVITHLKTAYPEPISPFWGTLINVNQIWTDNTAVNRLPHTCTALVDVRFIAEDSETIVDHILSLLPKDVTCEILLKDNPLVTPDKHPMIQLLEKSIAHITNEKPKSSLAYGYSDLSFFSKFHSAGVEFGVIGGGHHGEEEWVDMKSLENYYNILKTFLLSVDKKK